MGLESTTIHQAEVLFGFNGHTLTAVGKITLYVRTPPVVLKKTFMIVTDISLYNSILGRPWLIRLGVVPLSSIEKFDFISRMERLERSSQTRSYPSDALNKF